MHVIAAIFNVSDSMAKIIRRGMAAAEAAWRLKKAGEKQSA